MQAGRTCAAVVVEHVVPVLFYCFRIARNGARVFLGEEVLVPGLLEGQCRETFSFGFAPCPPRVNREIWLPEGLRLHWGGERGAWSTTSLSTAMSSRKGRGGRRGGEACSRKTSSSRRTRRRRRPLRGRRRGGAWASPPPRPRPPLPTRPPLNPYCHAKFQKSRKNPRSGRPKRNTAPTTPAC
jgi:hypothetical protein